jgi:hypothetical protein
MGEVAMRCVVEKSVSLCEPDILEGGRPGQTEIKRGRYGYRAAPSDRFLCHATPTRIIVTAIIDRNKTLAPQR